LSSNDFTRHDESDLMFNSHTVNPDTVPVERNQIS
jgi:hypothetical protein